MKIGDKVRYCESIVKGRPTFGDIGTVLKDNYDKTCVLVEFEFGQVWCIKASLEVVE